MSRLGQELLDLANAQVGGRYLFAGYNDQTLPFSGSPVLYNGTDDHQMIEVSPQTTVAKNITGTELFMAPVNLFTTLEDLHSARRGSLEAKTPDSAGFICASSYVFDT